MASVLTTCTFTSASAKVRVERRPILRCGGGACLTSEQQTTTTTTTMMPRRLQLRSTKRARARLPAAAANTTCASSSPTHTYTPGGPIDNCTVVVTGANRGIGLEFTKQLLESRSGNRVVAACRDPASADDLRALQALVGFDRLAITTVDVGDEASIASWALGLATSAPIIADNGGVVDVVINNAGIIGTDGFSKWDLETVDADEMMRVFRINTIGPLLVTQQLLKHGLIGGGTGGTGGGGGGGGGGGALVANVTSKVGSVDDNTSGKGYAYRASKSALNNVSKSISIDLVSRGVRCVLLHPGWVRTRMTDGRGLIDAHESAAGLIRAMEGAYGEVNGRWYDYKGEEIPW